VSKFGGNVKLQLNNDFQPTLSQYQNPLSATIASRDKFGQTLQKQILNTANHAQNLFQLRLYEKLATISTSKRIKKKLKERLFQNDVSHDDEHNSNEAIYSLKD